MVNRKLLLIQGVADSNNPVTTQTLPSTAVLTRSGSAAMCFNVSGTLGTVAANTARFDFEPIAHDPLGVLVETDALQNDVGNNSGVGCVAGTPGTRPNLWPASAGSAGLTLAWGGIHTENGITGILVRFSGTATNSSQLVAMGNNNSIAALSGQHRANGGFIKVHAGSLANITNVGWRVILRSAALASLGTLSSTDYGVDGTARWFEHDFTLTNGSGTTAYAQPYFGFTAPGGAVDVTFFIGFPMSVYGDHCGSPTATTAAAASRNADALVITSSRIRGLRGSLIVELAPLTFTSTVLFQLDDGTDDNRVYFQYNAGATTLEWGAYVGGVQTAGAGVTSGVLMRGEPLRIALSRGAGRVQAAIAGNAIQSVAVSPNVNRLRIGRNFAGTGTGGLYFRAYEAQSRTQSQGWLNAAVAV